MDEVVRGVDVVLVDREGGTLGEAECPNRRKRYRECLGLLESLARLVSSSLDTERRPLDVPGDRSKRAPNAVQVVREPGVRTGAVDAAQTFDGAKQCRGRGHGVSVREHQAFVHVAGDRRPVAERCHIAVGEGAPSLGDR